MPHLFAAGEKPDGRILCLSARLRIYPAIIAGVSPKKERLRRRRFVGFSCRTLPPCFRHLSTICQVVDRA